MTVTEFSRTLVDLCELEDSTTFVDELIASARAAVLAGAGTVGALTSGTANGKSFSKAVNLNPAEVLHAAIRAKRLFDGDESPQVVHLDFSRSLGGC